VNEALYLEDFTVGRRFNAGPVNRTLNQHGEEVQVPTARIEAPRRPAAG
jgi:hypothetical protein